MMNSIVICCPFNRPENLDNVLTNWFQQTVLCPLVLVCNEFGSWTKEAIEAGATVIIGQASIGGARNAGTEYAKKTGFDWLISMDDDNHYSPKYVEQIRNNITDDIDVLSQGIGFVRFDEELYLFDTELHFAPGHSTAYRVSKAEQFPEINLAEDVLWSRKMRQSGARFKHISPWYQVYDRSGNGHAYDATKLQFMKNFGGAKLIGKVPNSFVDKPSDLDLSDKVLITDKQYLNEMKEKAESRGLIVLESCSFRMEENA